ncbi:MAG: flagellar hook-length control protein FliK [Sulfurimonas sp.]|uniref:flagellar hook-length control protein FliK n=1 Tax=Sulfurimonas sp. TaxID=2022749 RepID=UPI00260931AF|nr:flagellar hook-length control protein FliK [Sulfurimonas sp.]MDD2652006.1 flagellar hook-length control protein FliK [Sulfurimonas sp.]MDD3451868.1 flagellar hook-length control protein FliK [Sulfurimonas sp.]
MVLLDMKNSKASSSSLPFNLSALSEKPLVSFADLLKGVGNTKDIKAVQNGSLVLSLDEKTTLKTEKTSSKTQILASLMQSEEKKTPKNGEEFLELNPKVVATLGKEEIKELVHKAKNYLKSKIQESDGYKKAEIKELPTTLRGLVEVAKKFDIDIAKITFEEVRSSAKDISQTLVQDDIETKIPKETLQEKKEPKAETPKAKEEVLVKQELKAELAQEREEFKSEIPKETVQEKKELKIEVPKEMVHEKRKSVTPQSEVAVQTEARSYEKLREMPQELKEVPLFKAQAALQHTSTEQIVQAKVGNVVQKTEQKVQKERAEDTLSLLLRGEKPSSENVSLTADFSVATAKVVAPSASNDNKNLEQLLNGESFASQQNETQSAKSESIATNKADSLEVKINEAKQMIKYLSNDVKSAIDDYRSPFTRVKVQLNPQNLGEVDLTVVQRGKNLHVNISSNNTAIQTLSMNINELRVQLNNNGINNATFNFSSGSQSGDASTNAGQQQRQNEQKAHQEYNYFENEDAHEEILSSLEIIVPRYI